MPVLLRPAFRSMGERTTLEFFSSKNRVSLCSSLNSFDLVRILSILSDGEKYTTPYHRTFDKNTA